MKIKVTQPFNDKEKDLAFRDIGTEQMCGRGRLTAVKAKSLSLMKL